MKFNKRIAKKKEQEQEVHSLFMNDIANIKLIHSV